MRLFPVIIGVMKIVGFLKAYSPLVFSEICGYIAFKITRNDLSDMLT